MTQPSIPLPVALRKGIEQASPDLLRDLLRMFVERLMGEDADAVCGAGYGQRTDERVNSRNGYREVLGVDVFTREDGAAWLAILRGLVLADEPIWNLDIKTGDRIAELVNGRIVSDRAA